MNPEPPPAGVRLPIRPEAVAFDLDGTLLDHDGNLSGTVARAVGRIAQAGVKVFIITGRLQNSAERHWRALGLDTPLACCNGAYIGVPGEEPFQHSRLSETVRRTILDIIAETGLHFNFAIDNVVRALKDGEERQYYSRVFCPVVLAPDPEDILSRPLPTKCLCIAREEEQAGVLGMIRERLGDGAEITTSNTRFIEIMPPGVDKGTGIDALARWMGTTAEGFIAVGDAMNDVPMLRKAGFAVSFKSGDPRMGEYADMLLPPLWEDGADLLLGCVLGTASSGRFLTPRSSRFYKK